MRGRLAGWRHYRTRRVVDRGFFDVILVRRVRFAGCEGRLLGLGGGLAMVLLLRQFALHNLSGDVGRKRADAAKAEHLFDVPLVLHQQAHKNVAKLSCADEELAELSGDPVKYRNFFQTTPDALRTGSLVASSASLLACPRFCPA